MQKPCILSRILSSALVFSSLFLNGVSLAQTHGSDCIRITDWNRYANSRKDAQLRASGGSGIRPLQFTPVNPIAPNTVGEVKALVILVDFPNLPAERPNLEMRNMLFGTPEEEPNGSVRQFFQESSYGRLHLSGEVLGNPNSGPLDHPDPARQVRWIHLPYNFETYAADPRILASDALKQAVILYPTMNWTQFDGNNDGYIDILHVIPSGHLSGFTPDGITAHFWTMPEVTIPTNPASPTPVKARTYTMVPEHIGMAVHAHEWGHTFGLPDLYLGQYITGSGVGGWSLMGPGADLNYGGLPLAYFFGRPVHFDAWSKIQLGWITPTLVTRNVENITLQPVQTHPQALKVPANPNNPLEYFLVENRPRLQGTYDSPKQITFIDRINSSVGQQVVGGIPGSGVIIYHVDERRGTQDDRGHLLVTVEEANQGEINPATGRPRGANLLLPYFHPQSNNGEPGDAFGHAFKAFTDKTIPRAISYDGRDSGTRLVDITAPPVTSVDLDQDGEADPPLWQVVLPTEANATLNARISSIIGAVFSPNINTVPDIGVRLLSQAREPIAAANITTSGTEFNIFDVEQGSYLVEITSPAFIPQLIPVQKGEGPTILRVFLLPQLQASQFGTGWNMIALPLDYAGQRISQVFDMPGLISFAWNGTEYVADPVVEEGVGYWVFVNDPSQMKIVQPGVSTSPEADQTLPIRRGWNLIGNPFPRGFVWNPLTIRLQVLNGEQLTLDQAFEQGLTANFAWSWRAAQNEYQMIRRGDPVSIFQGMWIYSEVDGSLIIPGPATPAG